MRKKVSVHRISKYAIQILFFIFMPVLFSAAWNGVRYIADQIGKRELIVWNPFIALLCALVVFTILFGRFFCGYACAFGSLGDWIFACASFIRKKTGKKELRIPQKTVRILLHVKYLILAGIAAACLFGVYTAVSAADPWTLFASFRAGGFTADFFADGRIWAAIALGSIVAGMAFEERFFCVFICPLGAVFTLLPMLPFMIYTRKKETCISGCTLCVKTCPAAISLGGKSSAYGECFQCGKCAEGCPKGNIRSGAGKLKGTEIRLTCLKAAILFAVCYYIMKG